MNIIINIGPYFRLEIRLDGMAEVVIVIQIAIWVYWLVKQVILMI